MKYKTVFFSALLAVFLTQPAFAGGLEDLQQAYDLWVNDQEDEALELVTSAIESGELDGENLAIAYYIRGYIFWGRDEDQAALDDFNAALDLGALNPEATANTHEYRGSALWTLGREEEAIEDFTYAIINQDDPGTALYRRGLLHYFRDEYDQAFPDLIRLANEYPEYMNEVKMRYLGDLVRWANSEGEKELLFALLTALREGEYTGPEPQFETTWFKQQLALLHLERGETNKALILIHEIEDTDIILETLIDNRYEPLWDMYVYRAHANLERILEKEIAASKAKIETKPEYALFTVWYADALRQAGKPEEAEKVLKKAIEDIDSFVPEDEDDLLWIYNALAYTYQDLGEWDKSLATFEEISDVPLEDNPSSISQHINHSISLLEAGRFEEALARAEGLDMDYASDFGDRFIEMGRACAMHELGRGEEAGAIADGILEAWKDNPAAALMTMLCLERYGDAKALILERLDEESERTGVLVLMQNYTKGRHIPPYKVELYKRFERIKTDPEVIEKVTQYGRILDLPLVSTYWGEL